jgi:hypothetical protein
MDFGTLKTVIAGALGRVPAGATASEIAEEIARSIQITEQIMGSGVLAAVPAQASLAPRPPLPGACRDDPGRVISAEEKSFKVHSVHPASDAGVTVPVSLADDEPIAPPRRVRVDTVRPADFEYFDVDTIRDHLENSAPPILDVDMGEEAPLRLFRQIRPDEGLKIVRLAYNPEGSQDGPYAIFATTQEKIGLSEKIREIKDAARSRFFVGHREVKPRIEPIRAFDPQSGRGGVGGDADEAAQSGAEKAAMWRASRSPEEMAFIRGGK